MALVLPCTFCNSLQLQIQRRSFPIISRRNSPIFRRGATTCEYRIPVEISSPADRGSLAVPSHKVTVHDRQRGVVHEFEVPEVSFFLNFDPYIPLILRRNMLLRSLIRDTIHQILSMRYEIMMLVTWRYQLRSCN